MSKKLGIIAIIISIIALGFSIFVFITLPKQEEKEDFDIQYVLFLGTNDKDTYTPYGTPDVVKAKVDEVLTKHVEGFTIQEANGGLTNDNGTVDHEYTVVILLSDTTMDKVHAVCDDLIKTFNQSSVLIQSNRTKTEFYSGK